MGIIVPAILPTSLQDLEEKLTRFEGLVDFIQIDVVDGIFAAPASWPYSGGTKELATLAEEGGSLPKFGTFKFDIDLMVAKPEEVTASWIMLGASHITAHAESTTYLPKLITDFDEKYGHDRDFAPDLIGFGLAIGANTEVALIEPYLGDVDYVQFMGIKRIGHQGEPFDSRVVERVRAFKKKHPEIDVQIDGGVTRETAPALLDAGADRLIVGHALLNALDVKAELGAFEELTQKYGLYD